MVSDKLRSHYGNDIIRVRNFFRDHKPHLPKELNHLQNSRSYISKLFKSGFLLRTRELLNYDYIEQHGRRYKWCRVRGYMYIRATSTRLSNNNTLAYEFKVTESLSLKTSIEKVTLQFITYEESRELQTDQYIRQVFQDNLLDYFKQRGIGATVKIISDDLGLPPRSVKTCVYNMVENGKLTKKGKWNPFLGKETLFRGKMHGYVYGLTDEQCDLFIKSGDILSPEANAILKEVIKNSNEKRLTPTNLFIHPPYNYDPASITYNAEVLTNTFPNIVKTESDTGRTYLYDKTKLAEADVEKEKKYWGYKEHIQHSFTQVLGDMNEKVIQMCLDLMGQDTTFEWLFQSVIRNNKRSFQIRLETGKEIDRVYQVSIEPFGIKHYFPIEEKYQRTNIMTADLMQFYNTLCNSHDYGCTIKQNNGQEIRTLKFNVTPIFIALKITDDAIKWANEHGMIFIYTWSVLRYFREKTGLSLDIKKLANEYYGRTNKNQSIDDFLQMKLKNNKENKANKEKQEKDNNKTNEN